MLVVANVYLCYSVDYKYCSFLLLRTHKRGMIMKKQLIKKGLDSVNSSFQGFKYVWNRDKSGKIYTILRCVGSILNSISPLVFVLFPGQLINELTGNQSLNKIILYILAIVCLPVVFWGINKLIDYKIISVLSEFNNNSNKLIYGRLSEMDFEELEKPDVDHLKYRALNAMERLPSVVDNYCGVFAAFFQFCLVVSLVLSLGLWMVLVIVGVSVLNFLASKWLVKKARESELESDLLNRIRDTYTYVLQEVWFAKEIRMFRCKDYLIDHLMSNEKETNLHHLKHKRREDMVGFIAVGGNFIQQLIMYGYLVYLVIKNVLSVGTMTIYISSVAQLGNSLNTLSRSFLTLISMKYSLNDIVDFFSIPQRQIQSGKDQPNLNNDFLIEFKNVSFKYPGSERYALKNINIVIRKNERLCIVGENGSGKSTFIKLLTRMYCPTEGEIFLNGKNIYDFDYYEYIKLFAPVFQDFCRYSFSVADNICLSDNINVNKMLSAINEAELSNLVSALPKKENTRIGKFIDENGFEPSGGEAQKIAIARAIYHEGDIYLLDEPTASLDPKAEYEIYSQFHRMIRGKSAILITHRLSAVQLADKVAVFDKGQVVEYGTHNELYLQNGLYTEMFDKQAQFYRDA